jgi:hypothetical protein
MPRFIKEKARDKNSEGEVTKAKKHKRKRLTLSYPP